ncbi:UDP-glucosyltransferase 2-like isoform X2 [Rhodnius prolixus]
MMSVDWMKCMFHQKEMKALIADNSTKYDLIIAEVWFKQEALVAFGHKYNAPVINFVSTFVRPEAVYLTGNHLPTSFVPLWNLHYTDRMSFLQRAMNTFQYYWELILIHLCYLRIQETFMREHFKYPGSESLPPLTEMLSNTSLTLVYSNSIAAGYPVPFSKNILEFGGMHVAIETKQLPKDLQEFMDNPKDGVIYFSFGSVTEFSVLDNKSQQSIISVLGGLKQKVMMKIEATNPFINCTKPNILVRQWFPQPSVLAHPNCKLFITHGGIGGVMEGIYHSVPMFAIPLFADQKLNAKLLEKVGIGYTLEPEDITAENFLMAINTVLNNSIYKENIKKRSAILKDQPIDTLEHVLYWIEYVIRHRGAPHLRPAVLDLHWYQYFMLDVIALYLLILIVILYVIKNLIGLLYNCSLSIIQNIEYFEKSKLKSKPE